MILSIIIGAIVGFIAGKIMNSEQGLIMNIIIGIVGSAVGRAIFGFIGFHAVSGLAVIIVSVVGACICIAVARKIK